MKSFILKICLAAAVVFMMIAPLTFLPPKIIPYDDPKEKDAVDIDVVKEVEVPEVPLHDVDLPEFGKILDVQTKKRSFFSFLTPAIVEENNKIMEKRKKLLVINKILEFGGQLREKHIKVVNELADHFKVNRNMPLNEKVAELVKRVDIIPPELVLAQGANESAWGTSRFARIGLNFFGIWCYSKDCGLVPKGRDAGKNHEVAAFKSVNANVRRYFQNINSHDSYKVFRLTRAQLRSQDLPLDPQILASGLLQYSERGPDYVIEITDMIRHNQPIFDELLK